MQKRLQRFTACLAFATYANAAVATQAEVSVNFSVERFNSSSGDLQISPDAIRRIVGSTLAGRGLRMREVGTLPGGSFIRLQADTLYVPSAQNIRVAVFRPAVMVNGKETCGMTSNSWGTGASSGERIERALQEVIAAFVKNCL